MCLGFIVLFNSKLETKSGLPNPHFSGYYCIIERIPRIKLHTTKSFYSTLNLENGNDKTFRSKNNTLNAVALTLSFSPQFTLRN